MRRGEFYVEKDAVVKETNKRYIQLTIFLALAFLGWIIPPAYGLTSEGVKMLGILAGAIYGWTVTSEVWPSLLAFFLIPFTGIVDLSGLMAVSWGSDIVLFTILIFILVAFLEETGASNFVAAWLLTRKFLNGHPWRLLFMLFAVAWLLCTFVNIFAGVFITWGIMYEIFNILGYKPYDKFTTITLFGVIAMGALSLSALPWAGNALVILNSYANTSGTAVNMLHYLSYSLPFNLCAMLCFLALCRWVFRLDVSRMKNLKMDFFKDDDLTLTPQRKVALLSVVALIVFLLIPSILPDSLVLTQFFNAMGLQNKLILIFIIISFIRIDSKPVFNFAELAVKGVNWNMIIMTMSIMAFVRLLALPATGISAFLAQILTPVFSNISLITFFIITVIITVFVTNFTINMVVAMIMMTVTIPIGANWGIPPEQIVYLVTICCTIAFILPAGSPAGMLLFSNVNWIKATDTYKYTAPTIVLFSALALILNIICFMF